MSNSASLRVKIQKMGGFLSSMVMPNIGVFIAWGLITAFVIPTGWVPDEYLCKLVSPTITYLLPLLIGYTGGYNVYGKRGGAIGALSTMGVIVGANIPMLIGGMIMGPLGAFVIKKVDGMLAGKMRSGLEMLVDNFALGIVGALIMIFGYVAVEPIFSVIIKFLAGGVEWVTKQGLIPLASLFVQPAQVLFLNNAVNHGIMIPLGIQQAMETGRSILFLVEANGGNWLGLLLGFAVFGRGMAKKTAPASASIMFLGGIGEVAFPYAMIKPVTLLGPILGNMAALFWLQIFQGGTVAAVSPGSFLALLAMTPKGYFIVNAMAYIISAAVSFVTVAFFLKTAKVEAGEDYDEDTDGILNNSIALAGASGIAVTVPVPAAGKRINKVIIACDAGMGSSAMGVSILKTKMRKAMLDMEVVNVSVDNIPHDADVVITNAVLEERVREKAPNGADVLTIKNFLDNNEYDRIVTYLKKAQ
jgi:PTS system mannitol-specific IIC component